MIGLVVKFKLKDGMGPEFEQVFARLAAGVKSEPGCKLYKLGKSRTDPNAYTAMEIYTDQAAIDAHRATPHMAANLDAFRACLGSEPPQFEFVDLIEA